MDDSWISRSIAKAQEDLASSSKELPDDVVTLLSELLSVSLQAPLKAADVRQIVTQLAKANNPGAK